MGTFCAKALLKVLKKALLRALFGDQTIPRLMAGLLHILTTPMFKCRTFSTDWSSVCGRIYGPTGSNHPSGRQDRVKEI